MEMNTEYLTVAPENLTAAFSQAREKLDGVGPELALDFSRVLRIDSSAVRALEELAGQADVKGVRLVLRGVNIDLYKVLTLYRLAPKLLFVD
jgi:ABC-type transporter Mla MlaB component